jgi:ABC-2 type transport system ATP-binding protein
MVGQRSTPPVESAGTIRLLMDLIRPDWGAAAVLGLDSRRDSVAVRRRVGGLLGERVSFPGVTAGYVIGLSAGVARLIS